MTYFVHTPEEHFLRQDPGEPAVIFRPRLRVNIEDEDCNMDNLEAVRDLGRTALAGRSVLRDHHLNQSGEHFLTLQHFALQWLFSILAISFDLQSLLDADVIHAIFEMITKL